MCQKDADTATGTSIDDDCDDNDNGCDDNDNENDDVYTVYFL